MTDLAKILNVTTGTDPEDLGTVQADADAKRPADWTTYLKADALKGAKIGILRDQYTTPSYGTQGSIDRYNAILAQLRAAGVEIVEMTGSVAAPANVPGNLGNEGWFEWIRTHPNSPYAHPNEILRSPLRLPYNRSTTANAADMTDAQVQAARDRRTAYKANWKTYLDTNGVDAVLYPGNTSDFADNDTAALGASFGSPPTSNIGIPGMVVPVGLNDHGHPVSMQFVGRAWDDGEDARLRLRAGAAGLDADRRHQAPDAALRRDGHPGAGRDRAGAEALDRGPGDRAVDERDAADGPDDRVQRGRQGPDPGPPVHVQDQADRRSHVHDDRHRPAAQLAQARRGVRRVRARGDQGGKRRSPRRTGRSARSARSRRR